MCGKPVNRSFPLQKTLAGAEDIAGAYRQDQIAGPGQLGKGIRHLIQAGAVDGAGDLTGQIPGGGALFIGFPGGVDLRQHRDIGQLQLLYEAVKQLFGAGVGMGLEGADDALIGPLSGHGQQGVELVGVMGIIVVNVGPVIGALALKPPAGTQEVVQTVLHGLCADAQQIGGAGGGQGVGDVVIAAHQQLHVGIFLAADDDIEGGQTVKVGHVVGIAVGAAVKAAEPEQRALIAGQRLSGPLVVPVAYYIAVLGHQLGEGAEGMLDILQILEEIQVVLRHVQDHSHGGKEVEEGVAVT